VIAHPDLDDYGFQPVPNGEAGDAMLTSAPGQLAFVAARRDRDKLYRTIVRFIKKWRNERGLDQLSSFAIELLAAHVQDRYGPARSVFEGLHRFFNFIGDDRMRTPIAFAENGNVGELPLGAAVLLDPVNAGNNVFARLDATNRDALVKEAGDAWSTLWAADSAIDDVETVELWRQLVGRGFRLRSMAAA
jgi:hypothetical protein